VKVSIADQIEESTRYRNVLQGFVDNGVEPKEGPSAAIRLDRAEAILLTLKVYEVNEADFSAYLAKQGKEAGQ